MSMRSSGNRPRSEASPLAETPCTAAGCGYPGDETAETVAGKLSLDTQADLLAAILRLTLPKGVGPFVEKLTALGSILGTDAAPSDTAPASKLRKQSTR